jgi:uncharacterized protein YecE (DUF72 family)
MPDAAIHVGVGGWDYDPWRETFYPAGLARAKQLEYAGARLTATEVNATFYRLQKPESWDKWSASVPDRFRFAVKASRFCINRSDLRTAAEAIGKFSAQGFTRLGDKLGPILWQLAPTKRFDADEISAFFALLPTHRDGRALRHAVEVRHGSFRCREFVALAQAAGVAIAVCDSDDYPLIGDLTADFVYCRLRRTRDEAPLGYPPAELDRWAAVARAWARGDSPAGLAYVSEAPAPVRPREVFLFVIGGAKHRNPAAAEALIARLE